MKHQPVRQGQTTTLGTMCSTLFDKCVGSLMSPADYVNLKMLETGPTVYSPYPRKTFADTITKAAHSPECWSGLGLELSTSHTADWRSTN